MELNVPSTRPGIAIISNCVTPYRVNLHRQIAERIPELELHTLITHGAADFDWQVDMPDSIHATYFGSAGDSPLASSFRPGRLAAEWRKGGRLNRYLDTHNIQAVILNGYRYLSYLRVIKHCHQVDLPLFCRNDSNILCERTLPSWKHWLKARVFHWWLPRTKGIMSMGRLGDEFFLQYGADPARLYRVPYLPDLDFFARGFPDQIEGFGRKYGLSRDRRYLLYCGRLAAIKRVELLIDAFVAIADDRPEWDLLVVGEGVCGDGLRGRVPARLRNRVIWTGFLEVDECVVAYHSSDVLVLPSDREPWAVVIQEAMAAGLAIIASDVVGAASELIEDHVTGRIFPAGDLAGLQGAILEVTDPATINAFRSRAASALAEWRERADPVAEVRRALVAAGALNP
jgi:glycosyltransferase involved in cell wall biosynthesis